MRIRFTEPTGQWLLAGLAASAPALLIGCLGLADRAWWPVVAITLAFPAGAIACVPPFRSWRAGLLLVPALTGLLAGTGIRLGRALAIATDAEVEAGAESVLTAEPIQEWGTVPAGWADGAITPVRWKSTTGTVLVVPLSRPGTPPTTFKAVVVDGPGMWHAQRFEWNSHSAAAREWAP